MVKLFAQQKNVATFWSNYLLNKKMLQILVKLFAQQKKVTTFWSNYLLIKKNVANIGQIICSTNIQDNNTKIKDKKKKDKKKLDI